MNYLKTGLLLAGFGLSVAPAASHAALVPDEKVPAAVQSAADQLAKACSVWPEFVTQMASASQVMPISSSALRDRGLCHDTMAPDESSSHDRDVILFILVVAFFALLGVCTTVKHLWRRTRFLIWRARQWRFT
jgi:hypothetical protein